MGNCIEKIYKETAPASLLKSCDKKAVRYFYPVQGCLGLFIKGYNVDQMRARVVSLLFNKVNKEKALEKTGLDPDEVNEIPPVDFGGWSWYKHGGDYLVKNGITADYDQTYLFSTSSEVLMITFSVNLLNGKISERQESLFYRDINAITVDTDENGGKALVLKSFGEKFSFAIENESEAVNNTIGAIKAKLREAKSR